MSLSLREPAGVSVGARASTRSTQVRHPLVAYRRRVIVTDAVALAVGALAAFLARSTSFTGRVFDGEAVAWAAAGVAAIWLVASALSGGYDLDVLGTGSEQYRKLLLSVLLTLAAVSTVSYLLKLEVSRGLLLLQIPLALLLISIGRAAWRLHLRRSRRSGRSMVPTAVVADEVRSRELWAAFANHPCAGFSPVVVVAPPPPGDEPDEWLQRLRDRVVHDEIGALAVATSSALQSGLVRRIGWAIEGTAADLVVAPDVVDVGGPRTRMRRAAGLPLIHLDAPHLSGPKRFVKRAMDVLGAGLLLLALAPLLLAAALAVRTSSPGPVLYRQARIGRSGAEFVLLKFRTMWSGSDRLQEEAWREGEELGFIGKHPNDPRLTGVGRWLRRWSVDELPQLFNVLRGDMSLVGPRPLQRIEVRTLPGEHERRLITRPGMTGLWQVSGRNTRTWEDRMHLDLQYVEEWSVALDLSILARTVRAVATGDGAY